MVPKKKGRADMQDFLLPQMSSYTFRHHGNSHCIKSTAGSGSGLVYVKPTARKGISGPGPQLIQLPFSSPTSASLEFISGILETSGNLPPKQRATTKIKINTEEI